MLSSGGTESSAIRKFVLVTSPGLVYLSPLRHKHHLIEKRFIADSVASTS